MNRKMFDEKRAVLEKEIQQYRNHIGITEEALRAAENELDDLLAMKGYEAEEAKAFIAEEERKPDPPTTNPSDVCGVKATVTKKPGEKRRVEFGVVKGEEALAAFDILKAAVDSFNEGMEEFFNAFYKRII